MVVGDVMVGGRGGGTGDGERERSEQNTFQDIIIKIWCLCIASFATKRFSAEFYIEKHC